LDEREPESECSLADPVEREPDPECWLPDPVDVEEESVKLA
jgi:hypothetical protein